MPTTTNDGVELRYDTDGEGHPVAFLADAGFGPWLWGWQYRAVAGPFKCVVPAQRHTDGSAAGEINLSALAADLDAVLGAAGADRAHLVGAGLGGAVALRYVREYGRARKLVLFGTTADGSQIDRAAYEALFTDPVRRLGEGFPPEQRAQVREWHAAEDSRTAFEAGLDTFQSFDAEPLYELDAEALVVHGVEDAAVPVEAGRDLADSLPHGTFEAAEGGHLAFLPYARAVNDRLVAFLDEA